MTFSPKLSTLIVEAVIVVVVALWLMRGNRPQVPQLVSNAEQALISATPKPDPHRILAGTFDESKVKSDAEWKEILTPEQYKILRQQGTEIPFTGKLNHEKRAGTYYSAGCDLPLFRSEQKFDSGTGWPSFWAPIDEKALVLRVDTDLMGEERVEVLDTCGNHLGHVFDDGPAPTGKRYCMNSAALKFIPDEELPPTITPSPDAAPIP